MTPTKLANVLGILLAALLAVAWIAPPLSYAQEKEAPKEMVFEAKMGAVTFDHEQHTELAKGDCTACHDKLFPQSRAPLGFKEKMHKPAEAAKASCAGCHHEGGTAFASKGNCKTCHVKK